MLTSHCTSLELSLALRESGYPQENALFYWCKIEATKLWELLPSDKCTFLNGDLAHREQVAAPLTSEILPKLPDFIEKDGIRSYLKMSKHQMYPGIEYSCGYQSKNGRGFNAGFCVDNNMADPTALTFIHLRQEQLI